MAKKKLAEALRAAGATPKPMHWDLRPEVLLCSQIPMPLHEVAPRNILGTKWWNKTRQEAYQSTAYHCVACGIYKFQAHFRKWLEGHELYTIDYKRGLMTYIETVPLCHCCHNYIHIGRLNALLDQGLVSHAKFMFIVNHGDSVLHRAGLKRLPVYQGQCAPWKKWRLVLNGKKHPPKFKTEKAWLKAHPGN